MKAFIYPHGSNHQGFFVQRENCTKELDVTKSDLLKMSDLRHNVLSESEYFQVLSTDEMNRAKKEFELKGNGCLIVVKR